MNELNDIPASILDLATINEGDTSAAEAFHRSLLFAQHAEKLGYKRYWFAEHHNMESVASSATAVLIGYVAGGTSSIRVGSGGVMLPNHAPLVIAEQFGTLASLYPGRIDLGIGRAPGTDPVTSYALRRKSSADINEFPNDVVELINYFGDKKTSAQVRAVPGEGTHVPVWLLGSSTYSAELAAVLGLPFAFAAHFAPTQLMNAIEVYQTKFKPSAFLDKPYCMACVNVIAADNNDDAHFYATSFYQLALGLFRNARRPLPPPVEDMDNIWMEHEKAGVMHMAKYSFIGDANRVSEALNEFVIETGINEIMLTTHVYDVEVKKRSMEIVAGIRELA
jgi:luciferase family oxidoreductase group 1